MTVFNKRNALVGFLALNMLKRRRRRNRGIRQLRGKGPKIALFSLLGLASLGAVVGIVAVLRRRSEDDLGLGEDAESEIVGEYVTASPEPIPAT